MENYDEDDLDLDFEELDEYNHKALLDFLGATLDKIDDNFKSLTLSELDKIVFEEEP